MNKNELISGAAKRCGHRKKNVRECLDALLCVISEELVRGGEVKVADFGRFYRIERKERIMKIPAGRIVKVPAMKVPRFKAFSHFNHFSSKY